eukprot:GHVU01179962.1.p1 GENE.GHVU01179962.1~~GHVU01179962.1.p1  ORF type:complete len:175 (-),score=20.44 GHVU01179962.1:154-630(-)
MATANAKLRLSDRVEKKDIDFAISTMLESFIQSQKHGVAQHLNRRFGKYRATASSPEEFVETLLCEMMARRAAKERRWRSADAQSQAGGEGGVESDPPVRVDVLKHLAKTVYEIQEATVEKYLQSSRFRSAFRIERQEGERIDEEGGNEVIVSLVLAR